MPGAPECPACGVGPMLRNGARKLTTWHVAGLRLIRVRLDAERYVCRACAREITNQDGVRADLYAKVRKHLLRRVALVGAGQAALETGWDARTVLAHVMGDMDEALCVPLPWNVGIRIGSKAALLLDEDSGIVVDVARPDPESLGRMFSERGENVRWVAIPVDPVLRETLEEAVPDAGIRLHADSAIPKLSAYLRTARLGRDGWAAAILAEKVAEQGWDPGTLVKLQQILAGRRGGLGTSFLTTWGREILGSLARVRDGPPGPVPEVPSVPFARLRAHVALSAPGGIHHENLVRRLTDPTAPPETPR